MKTQLFIIGGNESKNKNPNLLKRFIHLCGENPNLVLITGASAVPNEISNIYTELFYKLGARSVKTIPCIDRVEGDNTEYIQSLINSDGLFITGGNQVKLASCLLGTKLHEKIVEKVNRGMIYGGTSAGASIVSSLMVAGGRGAYNPRKNIIKLSGGLGLIDSIIVDQHFRERNRFFRLATAISINPHKIGVGIDENTALHIIDGEVGNIYGANSVTILDGREIEYSGHEDGIEKDLIALTNMKFHSLPEGWKYNFKSFLPSKATNIDENILNYEIKEIS